MGGTKDIRMWRSQLIWLLSLRVCVWGEGAQKHPHPPCARVEREGYRTSPRRTELLLSFLSVTRFLEKNKKQKTNPLQDRKVSFQLLGSGFSFTPMARQDLMAVAANGTEPLKGWKLGSKGTDRGGVVPPRACAMT